VVVLQWRWWWEEVVRCRCLCGDDKGGMCRAMEVFSVVLVWSSGGCMCGSGWWVVLFEMLFGDVVLRGGD